jgi:hypothetical protein
MEWCHDIPLGQEPPIGGQLRPDRVQFFIDRTRKGGAFNHPANALEVMYASSDLPRYGGVSVGFRIARTLQP